MLKQMKTKAKEIGTKTKNFISEHSIELIYGGLIAGGIILSIVCVKHNNHKYNRLWNLANDALNRNSQNIDDYGDYKILKILEPVTNECLNTMPFHESACEAFIKAKNNLIAKREA